MRKPEDLHEIEASRQRVIGICDEVMILFFGAEKTDCGLFATVFCFHKIAEREPKTRYFMTMLIF